VTPVEIKTQSPAGAYGGSALTQPVAAGRALAALRHLRMIAVVA